MCSVLSSCRQICGADCAARFSFASVLSHQVDGHIGVPRRGNKLFDHIRCPDLQTAGTNTGMAAEILVFQHILINQKLYIFIFVVHQPHDTHSSGFDVEIFQHGIRTGKGETGGIDLG